MVKNWYCGLANFWMSMKIFREYAIVIFAVMSD